MMMRNEAIEKHIHSFSHSFSLSLSLSSPQEHLCARSKRPRQLQRHPVLARSSFSAVAIIASMPPFGSIPGQSFVRMCCSIRDCTWSSHSPHHASPDKRIPDTVTQHGRLRLARGRLSPVESSYRTMHGRTQNAPRRRVMAHRTWPSQRICSACQLPAPHLRILLPTRGRRPFLHRHLTHAKCM